MNLGFSPLAVVTKLVKGSFSLKCKKDSSVGSPVSDICSRYGDQMRRLYLGVWLSGRFGVFVLYVASDHATDIYICMKVAA